MTEPKKIPRNVWYGLDGTSYDNIVQELKSEDPRLKKWASIYAIYKYKFSEDPHQYYEFLHNSKNFRYGLIIFTNPIEIIKDNDGIDDRDITVFEIKTFDTEQEIEALLERLQINPELFTPPWRCDYPL